MMQSPQECVGCGKGTRVGDDIGKLEGNGVGSEGLGVGRKLGTNVGTSVGIPDGKEIGTIVGTTDGNEVGAKVGDGEKFPKYMLIFRKSISAGSLSRQSDLADIVVSAVR